MDWTPLLTAGGGLGALAVVIIYLLGSNRADRKAAREELSEADARADAAESRERTLQDQIDALLVRARAAEDREAVLQRQVAALQEQLKELPRLREELEAMRTEITGLRSSMGAPGDVA